MSVPEPCWGFHIQAIPPEADRVIDSQERTWLRAGPRSWRMDVKADQPARFHESWLLGEYGPVRCDVLTPIIERRDTRLAELLGSVDGVVPLHVPMPGSDVVLVFEDAMMLLRAGWLAWPAKQRREALASLQATEEAELAKTS